MTALENAAIAPLDHGETAHAFTFGEPESVLDRGTILGLLQTVTYNDRWYEPPVDLQMLVRAQTMSPHHQSALILKRNLLARDFIPSSQMSRKTFEAFVKNWLALGNAYLERIDAISGRAIRFENVPAVAMRVGVKPGTYFQLNQKVFKPDAHAFRPGSITHLATYDLSQEIYGLPDWLAALQSGLLNEAATLFRRKYYKNGSHAGYILYVSEDGMSEADSNAIRKALRDSKGPGNFRNVYLHIPKGKKDGVQILPISEVAAKDEFLGIKNVTRDDMLAAHRVPPQLIGVIPTNSGGFGNFGDTAAGFHALEIVPLQQQLMQVNDETGIELIRFADRAKEEPPMTRR